jgi:HSP20 family protein
MITRWNPARDMLNLRDAMDRLFDERAGWSAQDSGQWIARLPIDAYTTDDDLVVTAAVPGVQPEDVQITVEGDTLTIRGEFPAVIENVNHLYGERYHGSFSRSLQLNVAVDVDRIEATFDNGLLTLVVPKAEEVKPRQIKVKTK